MPYIVDHKQKFTDLNFNIKNQDQLRRQANGGNSILFSYPPIEESLYIEKAQELYFEKAEFIDVSKLFVQFVDNKGEMTKEIYFYFELIFQIDCYFIYHI